MIDSPEVSTSPRRKRRQQPAKPPVAGGKALTQIDSRLCEAMEERAEAIRKVSLLVYWQDRLARVSQEIEQLIGYQQRLTGINVSTPTGTLAYPLPAMPSSTHTFAGDIPPNIGSIPAKQPAPSGANIADQVSGEAGFS